MKHILTSDRKLVSSISGYAGFKICKNYPSKARKGVIE